MKIYEKIAESIINDYYTANIKAEVILDMVLTPVISEILTVIGQKNKDLGIEGEMRLLAKEFPMLKLSAKESEYNYRNCNVDYLMCDEKSIYFVELKTTQKSLDPNQMKKYLNYLKDCKNEKFSNVSGAAFIDLLNHVSKTGYSRSSKNKPWGETEKDDLKLLFEVIIQQHDNDKKDKNGKIQLEKDWAIKEAHHADDAIAYLKKTRASSSKKYLFTAGQMLDNMKDGKWWDYEQIKLLYLVPSEEEKMEDIVIVTFQEIIKQADVIGKKMEESGLRDYWEWVVEILKESVAYID